MFPNNFQTGKRNVCVCEMGGYKMWEHFMSHFIDYRDYQLSQPNNIFDNKAWNSFFELVRFKPKKEIFAYKKHRKF